MLRYEIILFLTPELLLVLCYSFFKGSLAMTNLSSPTFAALLKFEGYFSIFKLIVLIGAFLDSPELHCFVSLS